MERAYKSVVLVVLDGLGVNARSPGSTWKHATMPTFRMLEKFFPFTTLQASGVAVGLPWGEEGNSEVGHLTIGAGKVLYHHLPRIITSIYDESFFKNEALVAAANSAKTHNKKFHIAGLFSSGSVHSYADHLYALLDFAKREELPRVYLHLFTDGKDAAPKEGASFFAQFEERIAAKYPSVKIATVSGRLYAMDRDENWDRVEKVYRAMAKNEGRQFQSASAYINFSYQNGLTDEFVEPAFLEGGEGSIEAGDSVVFFNFREDSMRELVSAFTNDTFSGFARQKIESLFCVTMTEYDKQFSARVAFPPLGSVWPLARAISTSGFTQLHIAETEKYAHVTYFFNRGQELAFPGETRVLTPSPETVHFDTTPEMSAEKITDTVLESFRKYNFILINFANADMVGHTGNFEATIKALEMLDFCLGRLATRILEQDGVLIITSDHGNAEEKLYPVSGEKRTKHTANPVPFFVIANEFKSGKPKTDFEITKRYTETRGVLSDVAPTVLALMNLPRPGEMTGINLLPKIK